MINPEIFRQYDIRGIWEKDISPDAAELIGKGFASYLLKHTGKDNARISIGWDSRLHSPLIRDSLVKGIRNSGVDESILACVLHHFSIIRFTSFL